ncbi:MAG: helix-turn-helix domain-containing protein [Clostridia bacterium]|nr:helix-turn-helix domain-containing protein [Clostridia bacterium]
MQKEWDKLPTPEEAAMAQLAYARWERAKAEDMAEYVSRRRTVDLAVLVRQVIDEELTDTERDVIRMHYDENMQLIEIAERMHTNKATASRTLQRAEGRIRRYLKYVVRYQHDLRHVPFLPLCVREAFVLSLSRYGRADDLAARVCALRRRENLTQEAVAGASRIPLPRLQAIEDGSQTPDARELLCLSAFFDVSADSILKGESPCRH